jgi:hypothetical protein
MRKTLLPLAALLLGACAAPRTEEAASTSSSSTTKALLQLEGDSSEDVQGALVAGGQVEVDYDGTRAAQCHGDINGRPAWATTGYYRISGGEVRSFKTAGHRPSGGSGPVAFELAAAGEIEMWFCE